MKNKIIATIFLFVGVAQANAYTVQGNLIVTGNTFSVGTSTLTCSNGNVGVGTTSPAYSLDVSGNIRSTTGANFATSSGNVGIGTTSPHDSLEIAAPALSGLRLTGGGLNHGIDFYYTGGTTYPSYIQVNEANSSAGWMRFGVDTGSGSSAEIMRLQANGNVGIGTTSPSQTLSVNGTVSLNTNSGTQIYRCSGGTDAGWILYGNSGAAQTLCTGGGGSLVATGVFLP